MADRTLTHIVLDGVSSSEGFNGRGGGATPKPSQIPDRAGHAQRLIAVIDAIQTEATASAAYVEIVGRPGEPFLSEKFDVSGLSLLNLQEADPDNQVSGRAVVRASKAEGGLTNLKRKLALWSFEWGRPAASHAKLHRARKFARWDARAIDVGVSKYSTDPDSCHGVWT